MNRILLIFVFLCSEVIAHAQMQWYWQHPYPQGNNLNSVSIKNGNIVAVGNGGTIISTTNSGNNWSVDNDIFDMKRDLSSVYFINDNTGWVCGGRTDLYFPYLFGQSKILKTTNKGLNWNVQLNGFNSDYNSLFFVNEYTGWCVGGSIIKTTNGGANWLQLSSPSSYPFYAIFFVDSLTGWIVDWHYQTFFNIEHVFKTTNGGAIWIQQYSLSGGGTALTLNDIYFVNDQTGWIIGNDRLLKTTNSGTNWTLLSEYGTSLFFLNNNTGWILSNVVKKTTNAGINWSFQDSIQGNCIRFQDANNGCIVSRSGKIYKTTSGGDNWNELSYCEANSRFDIFFVNVSTGFSVGDNGTILKTTNSGKQWVLSPSPINTYLSSVFFYNGLTGWIGSSYGTYAIYKTSNGGANWFGQFSINPSFNVNSIHFVSENKGFASGPPFKILKTTNSGNNWISQDVSLGNIQTICSIDSSIIIAASNNNPPTVIKSTNGGANWYECNTPGAIGFQKMDFINSLTGFAVGSLGKVFKTIDAGNNWVVQPQQLGSTTLLSIKFLSSLKGVAVNLGGMIYYTLNTGTSWDSILVFSGQLNSVFAINDSTAWICGFNGAILCSVNFGHEFLGIHSNYEEVSNSFYLSQNYPNPFNPSTKIKFDIPVGNGRDRSVKLIIYDILGREVNILVNEQLKPGTYEVDWDGSNYASGIYFYCLQTGEFSETKKMILMK